MSDILEGINEVENVLKLTEDFSGYMQDLFKHFNFGKTAGVLKDGIAKIHKMAKKL